jgi:transposase-like protein
MNSESLPQTQLEAVRFFADEDVAHQFLVAMRWPDGVACPRCGSREVGNLSVSRVKRRNGKEGVRRVWNCKGCEEQFTVKVGTLLEDSPLPLGKWLPAIWLIVNAKNGISSCELGRALGVTQKTAWFMLHRIRGAMHDGKFTMSGEVEADETYIGGKARNMHKAQQREKMRGTQNLAQTVVAGLLERTTPEKPSRVQVRVTRNQRKEELQSTVRACVAPGSNLYTDALPSYSGLAGEYVHKSVNHAVRYVAGKVHTNGIENFWSLLKRTIRGTYVCPAPFHLFRYLDEQATRFNERKENDAGRFLNTVGRISGRRLTFKRLIGKAGPEPSTA